MEAETWGTSTVPGGGGVSCGSGWSSGGRGLSLLEFSLLQHDLLLFFQGPPGDSERHLKFFNKPNGVNAHLCNQEPQLTLKITSQDLRFFSSQENNNNSTWHLLSAYNMPGTVRIAIFRSTYIHTHIYIILIVLKVTYSCLIFLL